MQTFPVTVENVKPRHFGRMLGLILGVLILSGVIWMTAVGLSSLGVDRFLASYSLSSAAITASLLAYALFLLLPRAYLQRHSVLRYVYFASAIVFAWRCIDAVLVNPELALLTNKFVWICIAVSLCILITVWNVLAVMKNIDELSSSEEDIGNE